MYKTKQFTLIFNSLHPKTVQSPLIIFWTSGPFKYFLTRRILTSENITNKSESCRSIFCRIEVNFMKFNSLTRTQQQSASNFVNSQKILFHQNILIPFNLLLISWIHTNSKYHKHLIHFDTSESLFSLLHLTTRNAWFVSGISNYQKNLNRFIP